MKDLLLSSRSEAEARSRAEWEKVLGRPRSPDDVTEFLWAVEENEDGTASLRVPAEDESRLPAKERARLEVRIEPDPIDAGRPVSARLE